MSSPNRNITINVTASQYIGFTKLAGISGASKNEYGKALIDYAIRHQLTAGENWEDKSEWLTAINDGKRPLPKVGLEIKAGPPKPLEAIFHTPTSRVAEEPPVKKKSAG